MMHFSLLLLGHGKHISYLIATDSRSYEDGMHCAKLKSNLHGTKFILYDNGAKRPYGGVPKRKEIANVIYTKKTWSSPRSLLARLTNEESGRDIPLVNAVPDWDPELKVHSLKFDGRATEVSVKNFKLVKDGLKEQGRGDERLFLLRLGKVSKDKFHLDFRNPLSPLKAFAIALSSFEGGHS
eukprot:m.90637 g.90637  ORF g.90637 m.90637 type:complete len:182 (+) comp13276_c0_seq4:1153-1698(+)